MTLSDPPAQLRLLEELPPVVEPPLPRLAVTGLVSYARCPRQCYWDVVERRPRPLRPAAHDAAAGFQLGLYALAAVDCWGREPESLRTTEWYVREGAGVTQDWDRAAVDAVRARLAAVLDGVAAGRFGPVPGSYCGRC